MITLSKKFTLVCGVLCLCNFGCSPEKHVDTTLAPTAPVVVSVAKTPESPPETALFADLTLDVYAYPKAIATQEDIALGAEDPLLKRNACLTLVALHMNRENPNQDFCAASKALSQALGFDSSLGTNVIIQRWLDVFALMAEMREGYEDTSQLREDNIALRKSLEKQHRTISYLETTLEELKKVEQDVAEKKRLYR